MQSFNGKTALITGGGSGIGFGLATALGHAGAKVALASTNAGKLAAATTALTSQGIVARYVALDVADKAQWPAALDTVTRELGPVDFLALNAGVAPVPSSVADMLPEQWAWSLNVNLMGVINGLQCCLPRMRAGGSEAHILLTSSIAAAIAPPNMTAYAVPKAGVVTLAEILRQELAGSAISTSVLIPAAVRTELPASSASRSPTQAPDAYAAIAQMLKSGLDPLSVGEFVLERIRAGAFYIFTHSHQRERIELRFAEILTAMGTTLI